MICRLVGNSRQPRASAFEGTRWLTRFAGFSGSGGGVVEMTEAAPFEAAAAAGAPGGFGADALGAGDTPVGAEAGALAGGGAPTCFGAGV